MEYFTIWKSMQQACPISDMCLSIYSDEEMQRSTVKRTWIRETIVDISTTFADDILLIATLPGTIQRQPYEVE